MDANKTAGEETRWQLHKNAACNPQQVRSNTPQDTTVRPPAPITKTIQVRRTRHTGHCWRSRDELIRDVLLWIPTHGRAKAGRPARTYIQQLCEDTGCCPEDLPRAMNDREEWRKRVRDIRAASTIWWWWWYIYIYIYMYIITVLVVTISPCGLVSNQVQYNMESAFVISLKLIRTWINTQLYPHTHTQTQIYNPT